MGYRLPFFPMYAAETLADGRFQAWNLEERGAWVTLLCHNWNDGDIPAAPTTMARLLGCSVGDMARIWSAIGDRFAEVPGKPGRMWSPRLEREREKAEGLSRVRSEAGRAGATVRWQKEKQPHGKRKRLPMRSQSDTNGLIPSPSPSPSPSHGDDRLRATPDRYLAVHPGGRDEE